MPAASPLQPWVWPTRPWTRLHIDFAGPKEGTMFLVIIDAHSKWMEVIPMKSATTLTTTQQLRMVFSRFGIPESIVSDNVPSSVVQNSSSSVGRMVYDTYECLPTTQLRMGSLSAQFRRLSKVPETHRGNNSRLNCTASIPLPYYSPLHNRDISVAVTFRSADTIEVRYCQTKLREAGE